MKRPEWLTALPLLLGDLAIMYAGLFLTLGIRYRSEFYQAYLTYHALPFSIVFALSVLTFYIAGLYNLHRLRNSLDFFKTLFLAFTVNFVLVIAFFYLIPLFGIAPKTNLFLYTAFFVVFETGWRRWYNRRTAAASPKATILVFGNREAEKKICETIDEAPQLGYAVAAHVENETIFPEDVEALVREHCPDIVLIPHHLKKNSSLARAFYDLLVSGVFVQDSALFFEDLFKSVPLTELDENWFLEYANDHQRFYDQIKRAAELVAALVLCIALLPLMALIAAGVTATSRGPVLIRQTRVGKSGRTFTLFKFRSMVALSPDGHAEVNGAEWARQEDRRVTGIGKFLRASHLDELPQLFNIVKGDLSFVGPRPERPAFVELLKVKVPFWETRHLIQPGVTGWAQINYRYGSSVEDAAEKLQYDLYYLKNRSVVMDLAILVRTIKSFFVAS